jgi:hypothetical protein
MGVVPVNGHWLSKRFCVTLETVGVACMRCSDVREKPRSSPPHPAKRRSTPIKTIINLVGMIAAGRREARGDQRRETEHSRADRRALGGVRWRLNY